ncbi:MAG: SDR family oxidoreductase [Deltaproteobacteria bacterium]|nr:SDR family oxidoreductase [Deltaproteobacteria bacterium]
MKTENRIAVVTGANRGLGFETARQLAARGIHVIITARDAAKGKQAADKLAGHDRRVEFFPLDVTDARSIDKLAHYVDGEFGRLDILVNNAGIFPDDTANESAFAAKVETLQRAMETNVYGPFLLCQKLIPIMKKNEYGRVVNLSSGMGQLSEMNGGYPAYRVSKTALNALTRIFSEESSGDGVLVNSVCPGWVKTDMGGPNAELSVEDGADTIVWLATLPDDGPTGGFFREREPIAW